MLRSDRLEEDVIAILAHVADTTSAVRRVLGRIAASEPAERERALAELTILAGLRKVGEFVKAEVKSMPILDSMLDHDLLGPEFRRGIVRGEATLLLRQIEKRFGAIDSRTRERIETLDQAAIEALGLRLLDARSLHKLLS